MTVYQLVAVGHLKTTGAQIMIYGDKAYGTNKEAEAAIPAYEREVSAPKPNNELMEIESNPLRVFIKPLEIQ